MARLLQKRKPYLLLLSKRSIVGATVRRFRIDTFRKRYLMMKHLALSLILVLSGFLFIGNG